MVNYRIELLTGSGSNKWQNDVFSIDSIVAMELGCCLIGQEKDPTDGNDQK